MAGPRDPLQIPRNPNPLPMETRIGLNQMESRMLRNGHVRFGGRPAKPHPPQGGQGAAGRPYTYVRTTAGFCYTAFITDTYSRRIVGWATRSTMRTDALPLEALEHALIAAKDQAIDSLDGLVHHSDRGSQYVSIRYTEHLTDAGITASVGSAGDAYDNSLAETVNGLHKTELIYARPAWPSVTEVEFQTMNWIHWWNNIRLHQGLDYQTPAEAEAAYYETQARAVAPA